MASNDNVVACEVIHDGSTVTVTSPKGGQVKVDIAKLRGASGDFRLYHKLTRQGPMREAEVGVTGEEMCVLLNLSGGKADTNGAAKKVAPKVSESVGVSEDIDPRVAAVFPPTEPMTPRERIAHEKMASAGYKEQKEKHAKIRSKERAEVLSAEAKRAEMATVKRTEEGANRKVTGYGNTDEERRVARAENAVKNLEGSNGDFYEFKYDIPSAKKDEDGNPDWDTTVPNPSWRLWRMGMCRDMLSKWFAPATVINSLAFRELIQEWDEFNAHKDPTQKPVKSGILRYHPDMAVKIREIARENLRQQIIEVHTSMLERLEAASRRYEAAEGVLNEKLLSGKETTPAEYERILKLRSISESGSINDAKKHCDACIQAARAFDETGAVVDLIKALHAAIKYNEAAIRARNELSEM